MQQQKQSDNILQNMNQTPLFYEFLKKLTQFILSFSVFSFLFLHSSWLPFFFHSFISQFSTLFSSQFLSLATDKNYIFLLCNGILVFIAKYSTRTVESHPPAKPTLSPDNDSIFKDYGEILQPSMEKLVLVEDGVMVEDEDEEEEEEKISEGNEVMIKEELKVKNGQFLITDGRQKDDDDDDGNDDDGNDDDNDDKGHMEEESQSGSYVEEEGIEEEEEEEEEGGIAKMSTEELNRKFEDFIRKMKEELRIEAQQQQLIMV